MRVFTKVKKKKSKINQISQIVGLVHSCAELLRCIENIYVQAHIHKCSVSQLVASTLGSQSCFDWGCGCMGSFPF